MGIQYKQTLPARQRSSAAAITLFIAALIPAAVAGASLGNQLNPDPQRPALIPDPAGLNIFQKDLRTPSGLLYRDVQKWPELKSFGDSDWQYELSVDAGFLSVSGDSHPASFIEYGDWGDGLILNRFTAMLENPKTAQYLKLYGGGIGRDDQYLQFSAGEYGKYDLRLAYDSIPHVFATNARVLWDGAGTDYLTLPSTLTPGASTLNQVLTAFQNIDDSALALERDKASLAFNFRPNKWINLFANGSMEWRDGRRPFGGGFTYPGLGQMLETVEPIDYTTNEITVGLAYADDAYQANFAYAGSFFTNHYQSLTWENAGLTPFVTLAPEQGRFALTPDNEAHHWRGDFAMGLPFWRSRFTTSVSYNQSSQNDLLVPPTIATGASGTPTFPINLALWNTPGALSTDRADAEIEALDLHAKITVNPASRLNLVGEFRYRDQDNHTDYTAYNPLTGEYGYITMDGAPGAFGPLFSGIYFPSVPGSRVRFKSMPFDKDSVFLTAGADYSLFDSTEVSAYYEREAMRYSFQEVDEVVDNRYQFRLTHRQTGLGTLRLSYEYAERDVDDYNPNPYEPFYTSSLPTYVSQFPGGGVLHAMSAMRKYDVAGKQTHTFNAKATVIIGDKMDLMLSGSYADDDYDADYGLNESQSVTANVEWNYQFALNGSLYAYYSYQDDDRRLTNIRSRGLISANADPGGPVYPLDRKWSDAISDTNHAVGTGLNVTRGDFTFDLNYSFIYARSRFAYDFASSAALSSPALLAEAGSGFPDQTYRNHMLEGKLSWLIREGTDLNFMYRYEKEALNDFHYRGLTQPVIDNNIFLLAVPENYHAHAFMITIENSF